MATSYKVLGQQSPAASTDTTIYTCPASTSTVVSTIVVCNRSESSGKFRISVQPNGETLENKHYIVYDAECQALNTIAMTIGITLDASDIISVQSSSSSFSFSVFGSEIT